MNPIRLGVFLSVLFVSGCSSASQTSNSGYGAFPDHPEATVSEAAGGAEARVLGRPDPYFIRYEGRWYYGWRVCARMMPQDRPAFFLLRGNEVTTWVAADESPDSIASRRVAQYCSSYLGGDVAGTR